MVPARGGGAVAALLGTVGFVAVFLIEGWARPGYSPAAEYVSALALGPRGWVQVANFVMVGGCLLAFALWLRRAYPRRPGFAVRAAPCSASSARACCCRGRS